MPANHSSGEPHQPDRDDAGCDLTKNSFGSNPDRPSTDEPRAIIVSRDLRDDLSLSLKLCRRILSYAVDALQTQLPKLDEAHRSLVGSDRSGEEKILDGQLAWDTKRDALLLANALSAVSTLQKLLHSDTVVADPSLRTVGESPIQQLLSTLKDLSEDPNFGTAGKQSLINGLESIDISLKEIFSRHRKELAALRSIPKGK